jgi:hypothetical protein
MQKLFNDGNYQESIKNGSFFRIERKIFKPKAGVLQDIGDVISVGTYCFDEHGQEVVYTHHYESPYGQVVYRDKITGAVYSDGRMDPKRILKDGVQYHLLSQK